MSDCIKDGWRTPDWLYEELDNEFEFSIDLCATNENSKCNWYCEDYLEGDFIDKITPEFYAGESIDAFEFNCAFMNPPYSSPKPFIEKAWRDSRYCRIVCLIKCDPSTSMWQTFYCFEDCVGFKRGPKHGCEIRLINTRIQFDPPLELINSGAIKHINGKWYKRRTIIRGTVEWHDYVRLSGPSFPSCLLIFDRRGEAQ